MERIKERKQEKEKDKNEQERRTANPKYANIKRQERSLENNTTKQSQNIVRLQIENEVKFQRGITLIALVIMIIVLLILAGITITSITSDNGIIQNALSAKERTEIDNEREIVEQATVQAMGKNKRGNIVRNELQDELDKITGEGKKQL